MLDKTMKDKIKPLTLGVIKEIVKKVDGLVPDDTPVLMDDHLPREISERIRIVRKHHRDGDRQYVYASLLYFPENLPQTFVWDVTNGIKEVSGASE